MAGMNGHKTIAVLVGLLALLAKPVLAEQRVALVIGNANYAHATRLANPLNDAADIGDALARLGFAVTKLENADYAALRQGMLAFTRAAAAAEVAVVFYAGHGIEVDQRNFLVPVDARLTSDQDVEYEAVPLELVTRSVARASGLRLVILDACRENPFAVAMQRSGATRSVGRGLARIEPAGETLVAYASKEGTVAADGEGRNSPYSTALLAHLEEPGLEIGLMFRKVRDAVLAATGGRQEPFVYGSLSSRGVYLTARAEPDPAPSPPPPTSLSESVSERLTAEQLAAERVFWESVKDSPNAADFEAYLSHYPQGRFALLAHNRLAALQQPFTPPELPEATAESMEGGLELSRADRRLVQLGLAAEGFDPGPVDGLFGRGTRGAIRRWQASKGEAATGYLDAESAKLLLAFGTRREAEEKARRQAEAEAERQRRDEESQARARREPQCTDLSKDGECWKEIVNQPGCFIWDRLDLDVTTHWSGACNDGAADGEGTLTRETTKDWDWYPIQETGRFVDGKQHGPWASRDAEGNVREGLYVDGKRHGPWVFRDVEGNVSEGPYVDGKRHGPWVFRDAEGNVSEGPYVDGKQHGQWSFRDAEGNVREGLYVAGEKHGHWVDVYGSSADEGPYVNGVKHGRWVERNYKGDVSEGPYVDGKRHGQWVFRDTDGHVYGGSYANDVKHGHWLEFDLSDLSDDLSYESLFGAEEGEGPYVDGKRHGHWVIRNADGEASEGPLENGKRHGLWVIRGLGLFEKSEAQGSYVDGKRHGQWAERYEEEHFGRHFDEGTYADGKKNGRWIERTDARFGTLKLLGKYEEEGSYVNGKKEGRWVTRWDKPERVETQTCVAGACN